MGKQLFSRRNLVVSVADDDMTVSDLVMPGPGMKLVLNVVPSVGGLMSVARKDGGNTRVSVINDGAMLIAGQWNPIEIAAPKFYSFIASEILYNFRYSVPVTYTHIVVYAEKEHAATMELP